VDWNTSQSFTPIKAPLVAGVNSPLRVVGEGRDYFDFMTSGAQLPDHRIETCLRRADLGQEILSEDEELHIWICAEMSG
jgi:hypothetical protein